MSDIEFLKSENQRLRTYISLVLAENELIQRVSEIRENFTNSSESEHIIEPILRRIDKIKSEKLILENDLKIK
ncbi:MAG: hypothetical protein K5790_00775 [Nitrosopumilus sp.]|uniref:hypothetical protein n=1 Tax=Nitrosopumilus sp. TaxID=2024843 RepID=UPI00247D1BEB|nr:hypothetical protein [Nitrosopumilus sp.]MCV0391808.1 hypothetical protein [Nitrosopumilus sp.]